MVPWGSMIQHVHKEDKEEEGVQKSLLKFLRIKYV